MCIRDRFNLLRINRPLARFVMPGQTATQIGQIKFRQLAAKTNTHLFQRHIQRQLAGALLEIAPDPQRPPALWQMRRVIDPTAPAGQISII